MTTIGDIWQTLIRPTEQTLVARLEWVLVVSLVLLIMWVWILQQALANSPAYHPKERLELALAWSFAIVAFVLAVLVAVGWWMGALSTWAGLAVHLAVIALALIGAVLLMPPKPGRRQSKV